MHAFDVGDLFSINIDLYKYSTNVKSPGKIFITHFFDENRLADFWRNLARIAGVLLILADEGVK